MRWELMSSKWPKPSWRTRRAFPLPKRGRPEPHFDLWEANRSQLIAAGVPAAQIEVSGIDTAQNTADFFQPSR
ncbi:MAG: laccase domain-containing protein [Anaerolineales bacterium]|nr:laccase domain-containing protein [Anaerolineales bacterium]